MSPELVTGIFTALGALIAGFISILGISLANKSHRLREREQEVATDRRMLRDSKAARIRSHYQVLLFTARNANLLLEQEEDYYGGRLSEDVIEVFEDQWRQAAKDCNVALAALSLETKDQELLSVYNQAQELFAHYLIRLMKKDIRKRTLNLGMYASLFRILREDGEISYNHTVDIILTSLLHGSPKNRTNSELLIGLTKVLRENGRLTLYELAAELEALKLIQEGKTGNLEKAMIARWVQMAQERGELSYNDMLAELNAMNGFPEENTVDRLLQVAQDRGWISSYDMIAELKVIEVLRHGERGNPEEALVARLVQLAQERGELSYNDMLAELNAMKVMPGHVILDRWLQVARDRGWISFYDMLAELKVIEALIDGEMGGSEEAIVARLVQLAQERGELSYVETGSILLTNILEERKMADSDRVMIGRLVQLAKERDGLTFYDVSRFLSDLEGEDYRNSNLLRFWKLQEVIQQLEDVARDHLAELEVPIYH